MHKRFFSVVFSAVSNTNRRRKVAKSGGFWALTRDRRDKKMVKRDLLMGGHSNKIG
jgi:hypothetical protein